MYNTIYLNQLRLVFLLPIFLLLIPNKSVFATTDNVSLVLDIVGLSGEKEEMCFALFDENISQNNPNSCIFQIQSNNIETIELTIIDRFNQIISITPFIENDVSDKNAERKINITRPNKEVGNWYVSLPYIEKLSYYLKIEYVHTHYKKVKTVTIEPEQETTQSPNTEPECVASETPEKSLQNIIEKLDKIIKNQGTTDERTTEESSTYKNFAGAELLSTPPCLSVLLSYCPNFEGFNGSKPLFCLHGFVTTDSVEGRAGLILRYNNENNYESEEKWNLEFSGFSDKFKKKDKQNEKDKQDLISDEFSFDIFRGYHPEDNIHIILGTQFNNRKYDEDKSEEIWYSDDSDYQGKYLRFMSVYYSISYNIKNLIRTSISKSLTGDKNGIFLKLSHNLETIIEISPINGLEEYYGSDLYVVAGFKINDYISGQMNGRLEGKSFRYDELGLVGQSIKLITELEVKVTYNNIYLAAKYNLGKLASTYDREKGITEYQEASILIGYKL